MSVLWPAIIWAGVGGSLGYAISYWIGLYYKDGIKELWPFNRNPCDGRARSGLFRQMGSARAYFLGTSSGPFAPSFR